MHILTKCKIICSTILFLFYSQSSYALLDQNGKGSAKDREGLVMLYTFDEKKSQNTIIKNQIEIDKPGHPTHLQVLGKSDNIRLEMEKLFLQKTQFCLNIINIS